MITATTSIRTSTWRSNLATALAIAALPVMSAQAHGSGPDEITISAPTSKNIGRDDETGMPIKQVTATALVTADAATLTTRSGATQLKDSVAKAARKTCAAIDPFAMDGGTCVRNAVASAKPQIHAAIADARNSVNG